MLDYGDWDAAAVDFAAAIAEEHGREIDGPALVKIISDKLTAVGASEALVGEILGKTNLVAAVRAALGPRG